MKRLVLSVAAALLATASPALAAATYSGTVSGYFDNPVLSGNLIAVDGSSVFYDNMITAAPFAILSPNGDTLSWGNSTTGADPGFSFLYFSGASFTDVAPDTPFRLGRIQYLNGTSDLDTLIFGAQLHLDLGAGIDPKTVGIGILTTANTGTTPARDADFIGFGGLGATFNVYENGNAFADVYGMIVGDPTVTLTGLQLAPGSESQGFIGSGVGGVPEPASWALLIGGFGMVGAASRRRGARTIATCA